MSTINGWVSLSVLSGAMVGLLIIDQFAPQKTHDVIEIVGGLGIVISLYRHVCVPRSGNLITTMITAYLGGLTTGYVLSNISSITNEIFTTACSQLSILKRIC